MTKDDIIKAAAKGGGLPEGLGPADTFLFLSLRALYDYAKQGDMDKEQGVKEKNAILRQYEKMDLWVRVVEEHRRKEREFEGAWIDFAKDPSPENADKLHRAWFKAGAKVSKQEETE
jgi:hypothetical protein